MRFISAIVPALHNTASYVLCYGNDSLLCNFSIPIPVCSLPDLSCITAEKPLYLGTHNTNGYYAVHLLKKDQIPDQWHFYPIRDLFQKFDDTFMSIVLYGKHIIHWNQTTRFCMYCASNLKDSDIERAKICPQCNTTIYPRLSPAIIVAIIKDNTILLARSQRFKQSKMFSILAGYVEPGETLEHCVTREIQEEVGISVKNIQYFGSQPWPFPDSLMIGFTATYASGEIQLNENELIEAGWFRASSLPIIPKPPSISFQLISWFQKNYQ